MAWPGSRMPAASEETAFGLAVDVGNLSCVTALFKGLDLTRDFGKYLSKIVILLAWVIIQNLPFTALSIVVSLPFIRVTTTGLVITLSVPC
jgi:hypothetical protein